MVNAGEVLADIEFQNITLFSAELGVAVRRRMGPFPNPASVRVIDEGAVKDRLNDITQRMMDNPIPERGCTDHSWLPFIDGELPVWTWLVSPGDEILLQLKDTALTVHVEPCNIVLPPFPLFRPMGGQQEVLPANNLSPHVFDRSHNLTLSPFRGGKAKWRAHQGRSLPTSPR